jgi:hypothetical protein
MTSTGVSSCIAMWCRARSGIRGASPIIVAADGLGAVVAAVGRWQPTSAQTLAGKSDDEILQWIANQKPRIDPSLGVKVASSGELPTVVIEAPRLSPDDLSPEERAQLAAEDISYYAAGERVMRMQTDSLAEARASTQAYYSDLRDRLTQSPPTVWGGFKYVSARLGMLAADVGFDAAEGLRGAYRFVTDAEVRSQTATQVRTLLQNPEIVKDAVVQSAQEFWAAPVDQKAEVAFKAVLGTLAGGGGGKVLTTTGRLAGNGLEFGVKTLGPALDDVLHSAADRAGLVLKVVPDAPRMEGYNAANSAETVSGTAANPALAARLDAFKAWKESAGIDGAPTSAQFRRFMGAHRPNSQGETFYDANTSGFADWSRRVDSVHGNTAGSQPTWLYKLESADGGFLKWGISQDPFTRYSGPFMRDKIITPLQPGPRRDILKVERNLVETQPGPLNFERWRGTRQGTP